MSRRGLSDLVGILGYYAAIGVGLLVAGYGVILLTDWRNPGAILLGSGLIAASPLTAAITLSCMFKVACCIDPSNVKFRGVG